MAGLTEKQKIFADLYLIEFNATKAYKKAYKVKSDTTAAVNAQRLLRNAKVKDYVAKRQESLANKMQITQEMVIEGYRKLAFYDVRNFYDEKGELLTVKDLDDETAFALAGLEVTEEKDFVKGSNIVTGFTKKIKMSDRKAALDSICRVLGFNAPTKAEVTGKDGQPLSNLPPQINVYNAAPPMAASEEEIQ